MVCSWLYFVIKKRRLVKLKEKDFRKNGELILQQQLSSEEGSSKTFKIFTAKELKKATSYYDENKIIAEEVMAQFIKDFYQIIGLLQLRSPKR